MLRYAYRMRPRRLPKGEGRGSGPQGRINKMRKMVTALIRYERIEGKFPYIEESRGYAERLLQEAMRHGDTHKPTMEMADYWLLEKDLIPKLFKVLAPRYTEWPISYTKMYRLPTVYPGGDVPLALLELRENPLPPVVPKERDVRNSLVNILVEEAGKDYKREKAKKIQKEMETPLDAAISADSVTINKSDATAPKNTADVDNFSDVVSKFSDLKVDGHDNLNPDFSEKANLAGNEEPIFNGTR